MTPNARLVNNHGNCELHWAVAVAANLKVALSVCFVLRYQSVRPSIAANKVCLLIHMTTDLNMATFELILELQNFNRLLFCWLHLKIKLTYISAVGPVVIADADFALAFPERVNNN